MGSLVIAIVIAGALAAGYLFYGRWLASEIFGLERKATEEPPSRRFHDEREFVPTGGGILLGHHATTVAGFAAVAGPAMAVAWGWLPAVLVLVLGAVFFAGIGDLGALVISARGCGQSLAEAAGRMVSPRARAGMSVLALGTLLLTVAALVDVGAGVAARFPMGAVAWGVQLVVALALAGFAGKIRWLGLVVLAAGPAVAVAVLGHGEPWISSLAASWDDRPVWNGCLVIGLAVLVAAYLPIWRFAQQRAVVAALFIVGLGLAILAGMGLAGLAGGPPAVAGAARSGLSLCEDWRLFGTATIPPVWPLLLMTAGCGAAAGVGSLVASGPTSKLLASEQEARPVGYGGAIAVGAIGGLAILACGAGLSLGARVTVPFADASGRTVLAVTSGTETVTLFYRAEDGGIGPRRTLPRSDRGAVESEGVVIGERGTDEIAFAGQNAWHQRYRNWEGAWQVLAPVRTFVEGSANFLRTLGFRREQARSLVALVVLMLISAGAEGLLRTARQLLQEIAGRRCPGVRTSECAACGSELAEINEQACPRCGFGVGDTRILQRHRLQQIQQRPRGTWGLLLTRSGSLFVTGVAAVGLAVWAGWSEPTRITLWPAAGTANLALLAAALLVVAASLIRSRRPGRIAGIPGAVVLMGAAWLCIARIPEWLDQGLYVPVVTGPIAIAVALWVALEVAARSGQIQGVAPGPPATLNVVGKEEVST